MPEIWGSVRLERYLFFTDSDDTLFPDTWQLYIPKAKVSGADLSVCGFTYLVEQTKECVDNLPEKAFCGGGKEYLESGFIGGTSGGNFQSAME